MHMYLSLNKSNIYLYSTYKSIKIVLDTRNATYTNNTIVICHYNIYFIADTHHYQ